MKQAIAQWRYHAANYAGWVYVAAEGGMVVAGVANSFITKELHLAEMIGGTAMLISSYKIGRHGMNEAKFCQYSTLSCGGMIVTTIPELAALEPAVVTANAADVVGTIIGVSHQAQRAFRKTAQRLCRPSRHHHTAIAKFRRCSARVSQFISTHPRGIMGGLAMASDVILFAGTSDPAHWLNRLCFAGFLTGDVLMACSLPTPPPPPQAAKTMPPLSPQ